MNRIFTKDIGKNFKRGQILDLSHSQWNAVAKSAKAGLNSFSKPVDAVLRESVGKTADQGVRG